ncbi:DNA double-strand break repair nuclease NurA [Bacillus haynesii]|uniref:DNA double-strand break repair nuclease NurA n=1 Tax=Bacillus haynesii TaxID=1925021 RepID=UPI002281C39F|nr:DNA double-strand break repair nuclease NurA [Bacillus haynesii]MCY7754988.1 DNA double-strand break repair nuclease NurA [Bacillus haynesii]
MAGEFDSKEQVKLAFTSANILPDMLNTIVTLSSKTQKEYIEFLEGLVDRLRSLLNDQIFSLNLNHKDTWKKVNKQKFGFIDGGMASISSLGSEPIAVRVGRYSVIPGKEGETREDFVHKTQLVDELYDLTGNQAIFEEFSDNQVKLRDMARITAEAGTIYKSLVDENDYNYLYLHGPLINPVAPYADYPMFTNKIIDLIGLKHKDIHDLVKIRIPKEIEMHFISIYFYILNYIFHSNTPVLGIIERNSGSKMIISSILERLNFNNDISVKEYKLLKARMTDYRITDAILFACLLREGEYIKPLTVDKNGLHKSPELWKPVIKDFPKPITTYIKVSDNSFPFRVEMYPANKDIELLLSITYHMARLLPEYGFPVGLDIVDKYAKVPLWMSKQASKEQSMNLLRRAISSGRTDVIDLVKLCLTGSNRDWLFRPKSK